MVAKRRDPKPFDEAAINAMAHAFSVALRRPGHQTPSTRPLDASQVVDKRNPVAAALYRAVWSGDNPHAGDARSERPAPRVDLRLGAAGRHNAEDAKRRTKAAAKHGAFFGDGRVERPAPRFGASSNDDYAGGAQAGASDRPRVQQHAKPKPKKAKPIFNQGRHDS